MAGRTRWAAALAALWAAAAGAQPADPTVVHGSAQFQQLGKSLLVTTTNGAGTRHSVIDWRSFSVPAGSVTRFLQPGVDSTSINRVTGNRPSEIFGTLSSNGQLVLVNPAGIAVGRGAVIDTAGFTASALGMSDADARAGLLRFEAGGGKGKGKGKDRGDVDVAGSILARNGDVVLIGTDVQVAKEAVVRAPDGSVLLAAGQRVSLTGRGLEGIVLEVTSPSDKVVNLGRLEGDAVGLFASQLRHTGVIRANHVVLQGDKVRLEKGRGKGPKGGKDDPKGGKGPGHDDDDAPPDDSLGGSIDVGSPAPADDPSAEAPAQGSDGGDAAMAVMEAGATQAVLTASQELAAVQPPAIERKSREPRKRADVDEVQQCTP